MNHDSMATVTETTSFFPSLRNLINEGGNPLLRNDDWWLLDEILFETSANAAASAEDADAEAVVGEEEEADGEEEEESPSLPTELPTLTSLGIGRGSNRW